MSNNLIEKITPQNIDAERAVIGSCLLDNSAVEKSLDILNAQDFYVPSHQFIFDNIRLLKHRNMPVDLVSVTDMLQKMEILEDIGGWGYLDDLTNSVPSTANIEMYVGLVKEKSIRRDIIKATNEIQMMAYNSMDEISIIVDKSQEIILNINSISKNDEMQHISEIINNEMELAVEAHEKGFTEAPELIKTGIDDLDNALGGGLNPGDLVIIGGRPGQGKSAFSSNIAVGVAKNNRGVGIINLEMPNRQTVQRMIASESKIQLPYVKSRIMNEIQLDNYMTVGDKLSKLPIKMNDLGNLSVTKLKSMARKLKVFFNKPDADGNKYPLGALVLDYLQLMDLDNEDEIKSLSKITKAGKQLAMELNIPVIFLSQLSRALETRQNKRPQLSDLRQSGSIEQDADIVSFVYRDEYYNPNTAKSRVAEIIIGKFRNGPTGTYEFYFDGDISKFSGMNPNNFINKGND